MMLWPQTLRTCSLKIGLWMLKTRLCTLWIAVWIPKRRLLSLKRRLWKLKLKVWTSDPINKAFDSKKRAWTFKIRLEEVITPSSRFTAWLPLLLVTEVKALNNKSCQGVLQKEKTSARRSASPNWKEIFLVNERSAQSETEQHLPEVFQR